MTEQTELKGIRGWLLVYTIGVWIIPGGILGYLAYLAVTTDWNGTVDWGEPALYVLLLPFFQAITVLLTGQLWVRASHISLLGLYILLALVSGQFAATPGAIIWLLYWIKSKRVANTYGQWAGHED